MIRNILRKITKTYILKYNTYLIFCLKNLITIFLKSKKHFSKIFILFKIKKKIHYHYTKKEQYISNQLILIRF